MELDVHLEARSEAEGTTLRGGLLAYKSSRDKTGRQRKLGLMWCGGCVLWPRETCGANDADFSITLLEMFISRTTYL